MPNPVPAVTGDIGFSKEATFGTPVAASSYWPFTSDTLLLEPGLTSPFVIRGLRDMNTYPILTEQHIKGNIVGPLYPNMGMQLFAGGLGQDYTTGASATSANTLADAAAVGDTTVTLTDATGYIVNDFIQIKVATGNQSEVHKITGVATNVLTLAEGLSYAYAVDDVTHVVVAPFTHTITPQGAVLPNLPSFTLEKNLGGVESLQFAGSLMDTVDLKLATNTFAEVTYGVIGQQEADIDPTTPTYNTTDLPFSLADISFDYGGGADVTTTDIALSIKNGAKEIYTFSGQHYPTFIPPLSLAITGTLTNVFENMTQFDNAKAATSAVMSIILSQGSGASCTLNFPKLLLNSVSQPLRAGDVIMQTVPFTAFYDFSSGYAMQTVIVNSTPNPY